MMNGKYGTVLKNKCLRLGTALVSLVVGVLWLACIGSSAWAQSADSAIASAEAPMVNLPSDAWGQPAASRTSSSRSQEVSRGGDAVNIDLESGTADAGVSPASRTGATSRSAAPTDPAPADDIAVAAGPTAVPVVQRSTGAAAASGLPAASAPGEAGALPVTSAGDYDGPTQ